MATAEELKVRYDDFHLKGKKRILERDPGPPVLWGGLQGKMHLQTNLVARFGPHPFLRQLRIILGRMRIYEDSFLAIRDFIPHATIKVAKEGEFDHKALFMMSAVQIPNSLTFDRLIFDPASNILLTSTCIPQLLEKARRELDEYIVGSGIEPVPIDILHSAICRFVTIATLEREVFVQESQKLIAFVEEVDEFLQNHPVTLPVSEVFLGTIYDTLEQ